MIRLWGFFTKKARSKTHVTHKQLVNRYVDNRMIVFGQWRHEWMSRFLLQCNVWPVTRQSGSWRVSFRAWHAHPCQLANSCGLHSLVLTAFPLPLIHINHLWNCTSLLNGDNAYHIWTVYVYRHSPQMVCIGWSHATNSPKIVCCLAA